MEKTSKAISYLGMQSSTILEPLNILRELLVNYCHSWCYFSFLGHESLGPDFLSKCIFGWKLIYSLT